MRRKAQTPLVPEQWQYKSCNGSCHGRENASTSDRSDVVRCATNLARERFLGPKLGLQIA